jgi:hypothetical protein
MPNYSLIAPAQQWVDANGNPASGYRLFTYSNRTATKKTTTTTADASVPNSNPITLDSNGRCSSGVFGSTGAYTLLLAPPGADDPPLSTTWSRDDVSGINDVGTSVVDQWIASGFTPTFISTTSFSVAGDQTSSLQVGRRIKTTNSGGTAYSTIFSSSFGAGITTVVVTNDSLVLDSGISAVSYGVLTPNNPSEPTIVGLASSSVLDEASDFVEMLDTSAGIMVKVPVGTFKATTYLVTNFAANTGTTTVPFLPSGLSTIPYSEIDIIFVAVSISNTDDILIQLIDTTAPVTAGYFSRGVTFNGAGSQTSGSTAGFIIPAGSAAAVLSGVVTLKREKIAASPGGDSWVINGGMPNSVGSNGSIITMGRGTLNSASPSLKLDGLRLITTGAGTFDAGAIYVNGRT